MLLKLGRILTLGLILCVTAGNLQAQQDKTTTTRTGTNKYNDNVDDRMKGPNGEKIYIGERGGRYYIKDGKKVYVPYKGSKYKKNKEKKAESKKN
ncbi:MAG TPA: hypothetical protein VIK80_06060 [Flavihumibacter sp.]|jgi:hypothetical protein